MKKLRFRKDVNRSFRTNDPLKRLTVGLVKSGGRNHHGRITVRHHGGGHKQSYRLLQQPTERGEWRIVSIQYDPNRTAWIALVVPNSNSKSNSKSPQEDQEVNGVQDLRRYIVLTDQLNVGDRFKCVVDSTALTPLDDGDILFERKSYVRGDRVPLGRLTVGSQVHNVQVGLHKLSSVARAAGTYCLVVAKDDGCKVLVKFPSGKSFWVEGECCATVGQVSNVEHHSRVYSKAGEKRWLGIRPTVRGVAMNPVDHPHGGGHGSKGGRHSVSPWGRLTKGKPTAKLRRKKK